MAVLVLAQYAWAVDAPSLVIAAHIAWVIVVGVSARNQTEFIFLALASALPISYVNVTGVSEGLIRASAFNLMSAFALIYFGLRLIIRGRIETGWRIFVVFFGCMSIIALWWSVMSSLDTLEGIRSLLAMAPAFLPMLVLPQAQSIQRNIDFQRVVECYLIAASAMAVFIVIQAVHSGFGTELGTNYSRAGRISFAGAWFDYSLVSGYLASALAGWFFLTRKFENRSRFFYPVYSLLFGALIVGLVLSGARAGIFAIGVALPLFILYSFGWKERLRSRIILLAAFAIFALSAFSLYVRPSFLVEGGFVDTTRLENWSAWFELIVEGGILANVFGHGLGSVNHASIVEGQLMMTPHNLVIEGMLNGGITLIIYTGGLLVVGFVRARVDPVFSACLAVGTISMLVSPSAYMSRFFPFLLVLAALSVALPASKKHESRLRPE